MMPRATLAIRLNAIRATLDAGPARDAIHDVLTFLNSLPPAREVPLDLLNQVRATLTMVDGDVKDIGRRIILEERIRDLDAILVTA